MSKGNTLVTAHKTATVQNNIGTKGFMKWKYQLAKIQYNPIFKTVVSERSKRYVIATMKCK